MSDQDLRAVEREVAAGTRHPHDLVRARARQGLACGAELDFETMHGRTGKALCELAPHDDERNHQGTSRNGMHVSWPSERPSDRSRLTPPVLASRCGCGAPWKALLEGETTTAGFYSPPPGPDGRVHYHDTNRVGLAVRCEAGHVLGGSARYRCWCGWSAEDRR